MKSTTVTATFTADIFDGDWKLQMLLIPRLTPSFKLELSFSREFPASLGRASPLPVARAI
ncbi:MAG: hypothetical protein LBB26_02155 [Puniceicoccales bacterium]|jgi:hypothetical protein|nr:hypothetical protein [Puniceicoccales bacterium]